MIINLAYCTRMTWEVDEPTDLIDYAVTEGKTLRIGVEETDNDGTPSVEVKAWIKDEPDDEVIGHFTHYSAAYEAAKAYVNVLKEQNRQQGRALTVEFKATKPTKQQAGVFSLLSYAAEWGKGKARKFANWTVA